MLKNNRKTNISKYFFISILIICLLFTAVGICVEDSYAVEINGTVDDGSVDLIVEDKLTNSHDGGENLEVSDEKELLSKTYTLNGGTFSDIQNLVNSAKAGDTIKLSGSFNHDGKIEWIKITKKLTITSDKGATLNGLNKYSIMGIYQNAAGSVVKNIKFINANGEWGSAIRILSKNILVENCDFINNHHASAGALSTVHDIDKCENLIVRKCNFIGNNGYKVNFANTTAAGALGAYSRNSQIIDCTFDSNWIKAEIECYGGALQIGLDFVDSNCKVTGCVFKNNYAIANKGYSHGGAGCVRDGVDYSNCIFINNTADQGGALTMHATGNIVNCIFMNNTATKLYGGAISSGYLYESMVLKIINCDFEGNVAPEGGAIQAIGLNVNILNSNFEKNHVTGSGGAISVHAVNVLVDKSNFTDNVAEVNGGAVYMKGEETKVMNSIFISNDAIPNVSKLNDGLGGAMYINSPKASVVNNEFNFNTARNGSAIYYEKTGENLYLADNNLYQNQAWVYQLPISVNDIFYEDKEEIRVIIYGGNNIADYDNLAISNAIYNAANFNEIMIDGENPIYGATNDGELYQDGREYNIAILLNVEHEDGTSVYNNSMNSSYLGEIAISLDNLKPGKYYVTAKHFEDTYYKQITNSTSFTVYPKVDNQIVIYADSDVYNFEDVVVWTVNVTNNGPNNATGVYITNVLPVGLIYFMDNSGGKYNPQTGILNVSTLDVGEKLSFKMITIVNKTGEITNVANINSLEFDTDLSNNRDDYTITVNPAADLEVLKSVNNTNPNYYDLVNWTIVIRNNGPDIAHNITFRDVIPNVLILVNCSDDFDSNNGICRIESLNVGEVKILNFITRVVASGIIENNAEAYGAEFDYDLSNNHDAEAILVDPASDLSIIKTVNASEINYLDIVKWTLTVTNNGPDNATEVNVVDILPEGFTYINSTWNYDNDEIYVGNLSVSQTIIIDIICKAEITGNYTNFANVTCKEYDYNLKNNHDNESIIVNPAVDLEIEKTVGESEPKFGDFIEWIITVRNNGPDVAHNVTVYELIPVSLIYVEDDSEGEYNYQTGIWDIGVMDVDDEYTLTILCKVNKTGVLTNNVNVTSGEYDYYLENNHDNESVEVEPSADVSIIKIVNNTNPNYNDFVKWSVMVTNNGPDIANNVEITEKIPEGLILINYVATKGEYLDDMWRIDSLEKGNVEILDLLCRVNKTGNITNVVVVTADEYDPNSTNNDDNETINVPLSVDIEVIQDVTNSTPYFGDKIMWLITIKNNGPDNATEVKLTDILPNSLIFLDYNSTKGKYDGGIWDVGFLEMGGVEYLNITCITNEIGVTVNDAFASAFEYDWNMSNNYDGALINVLPVTDLSIEKYVDNPNPNYLESVTWTLKVFNNGPNDASNVTVLDMLPKGLKLIKTTDDENYDAGNWFVGDLKVGETKVLKIICKVMQTGVMKNIVSVNGDYFDPNLDNNYDEETINVKLASDLEVTKVSSKTKYFVGDAVKYTIKVVNNGPDDAYNVKLKDILDGSLILKSFKTTKGTFDKSTKTWKIDCLKNGEWAILIINVIATVSGIVKNTVTVISDSYDYNDTNNNASCFIDVSEKSVHENSPKKVINTMHIMHKTGNPIFLLVLFSVILISFLSKNDIFK